MRLTYNWLKDFVDIKISAWALAEKLIMAGLEVTSLEKKDHDFVFEIEVTSNRPDCLSVMGIAREVAAITNSKLSRQIRDPDKSGKIQKSKKENYFLKIAVENKKDCPLYTAKIIKDVKVGPSPDWLKARLELVGCRSINNVVDISNYILLEQGQPLHVFDLDKLVSQLSSYPVSRLKIIIRRAKKGEGITTIDGIKRILNEEVLVIAAAATEKTGSTAYRLTGQPIAIAGIMGGKDTEVSSQTRNILLEAAIFNPLLVRRGRQKLGLHSESAYRFERGVDLGGLADVAWQATHFIQEICGGSCVLSSKSSSAKVKKTRVSVSAEEVRRILGAQVPTSQMRKIWHNLGFIVKPKSAQRFLLTVPSFRLDVSSEIDLVEEVARLFGYSHIPTTQPAWVAQISSASMQQQLAQLKAMLTGLGLQEVITYSLVDKKDCQNLGLPGQDAVEIANPLSQEQALLRSTLLPSLVKCIAHNLNQQQDYVPIFEVAKVFTASSQAQPQEEFVLGIALCGIRTWLLPKGALREALGILHLKGILETVFSRLGIEGHKFCDLDQAGRSEVYVQAAKVGTMVLLSKNTLERLGVKNKTVAAAELSLERLFAHANLKQRFSRLAAYPGISRDISLVLKEGIRVEDLLTLIKEKAGPLLCQARIVDYYQGEQIPSGFKGLTVSCFYRAAERTLTEEEISPLQAAIIASLQEKFAARIR